MLQPFDLNLRHLRAIPLIQRRGSMSAAAEGEHLSQPALTQGLAKLERQLGARLFERRPDGMTATAEGAAFAGRVEAALGHLAGGARAGARGFARPERLMTATQLRAFLALADAGSFVEAAQTTGWSQPALHRAVRELEQVSGLPLAERRGRGVILTSDGRRLARGIRLAASELAAAILEIQPDGGSTGRIVVGAMPLCRARLLPGAIASLMREAPGARFDVIEGSWRELVEPLRDGIVDLMIGALRDEAPLGTTHEPLFEDRLIVVARAGHPLAGTAAPSLAALAAYPWIVGSPNTPMRAHWESMFADVPRPAAPIECGSVMTIRGILLGTDYLALLSPDQVSVELDGGLLAAVGPPREDLVRTIGLTTRLGWRPTHVQARFVALLRAISAER